VGIFSSAWKTERQSQGGDHAVRCLLQLLPISQTLKHGSLAMAAGLADQEQ
jgi:hypothetical protein